MSPSENEVLDSYRAVSPSGPPKLAALVANHFWLAVFVRSHHEKRIAQHCLLRDIESFLPLYSEVHTWANRCKATVELPLFPNYLFVRGSNTVRRRVLDVPGVLSIVCRGAEIAPVPDAEIESLRSGLRFGKLGPHPYLAVGERVCITAGPLKGMEGILLRNKNNLRVVITISQIAQSVAVEVDAADVEYSESCP